MAMTKSQLVGKLALMSNQTNRVSEQSVNVFFREIKDALARGDKVEIRGFGSFLLRHYEAYQGRNPRTGEQVEVPHKKLPFFRAGKDLRDRVNVGVLHSPKQKPMVSHTALHEAPLETRAERGR